MALATPADIVNRLGRALTDTEANRVAALLEDASAAVQDYVQQTFTAGTSTVILTPVRGRVTLAQRPVTSITSVKDQDGNDIPYTWYSGETVLLSATDGDVQLDLDGTAWDQEPVTVIYTHGGTVPQSIVAVVCSVVLRALGRTPLESGVMQQSIAGYSETIGPVGAAGPVGLLPEEKALLERYRRPVDVVMVW